MKQGSRESATRKSPAGAGALRPQGGFTLVELMVVLLILGILISIALPTYAGARQRAEDRARQADLRTALAAATTYWSDRGLYAGFDVTQAKATEPSLQWISPGPPAVGEVDIEVASGGTLLLIGLSRTGTYFCLAQTPTSPVTYLGHDRVFANIDTLAECNGGW